MNKHKVSPITLNIFLAIVLLILLGLVNFLGDKGRAILNNDFLAPILAVTLIVVFIFVRFNQNKKTEQNLIDESMKPSKKSILRGPVLLSISLLGVLTFSLIGFLILSWLSKVIF